MFNKTPQKTVRMLSLIFLSALLPSITEAASAFKYLPSHVQDFDGEHLPETRHFSEFDAETESDYLTYSPMPARLKAVLRNREDFFTSAIGSISGKRFYVNNYLTVSKELHEKWDFRFQWIKEEEYQEQLSAPVVELLYGTGHSRVGLHGTIDSYKANDDIGLSYNWSGDHLQLRAEATAIDFTRNQRNEETDLFQTKPYTFAISALSTREQKNTYLKIYGEPKYRWRWPDVATTATRSKYGVLLLRKQKSYTCWSEYFEISTQVNAAFEDSQILRGHCEYASKNKERTGLRIVKKSWQMEDGEVKHYDILPFYWYTLKKHWDLGYELGFHRSSHGDAIRAEADKDQSIEHRLNLAWVPLDEETGRFEVFFTLDLDNLFHRAWQGGAGQLTLEF